MKREDSGLSVFYRENKRVFAFDSNNEPVAEVMDGEIVIFRTHDCFDNQLSEEGTCIGALNWDRINPATGPVYVQNAMAGDVLKVEILEITLDQQGVMCALPDNGVLGSLVKEESVKRMQVEGGKVHFNDKIVFDVTPIGMLLSAVGDLRFCQVVDPERTVMMSVPKKIMKRLF